MEEKQIHPESEVLVRTKNPNIEEKRDPESELTARKKNPNREEKQRPLRIWSLLSDKKIRIKKKTKNYES